MEIKGHFVEQKPKNRVVNVASFAMEILKPYVEQLSNVALVNVIS